MQVWPKLSVHGPAPPCSAHSHILLPLTFPPPSHITCRPALPSRNDCPALTNLYLPRHPIPSQEMCKIYLRMDQPNTALERYTAALQVQ